MNNVNEKKRKYIHENGNAPENIWPHRALQLIWLTCKHNLSVNDGQVPVSGLENHFCKGVYVLCFEGGEWSFW